MANAFWCIVEDDRQGMPKKVMAEVIGEAARLAGGQVEAVWLTDTASDAGLKQLGEWGATRVWLLENAAYAPYRSEVWAGAVAELAAKESPKAILAPVTSRQREFMARLAARLGVGLSADSVALAMDGEDGGTGAAYNVSMNAMGYPIASNLRDAYLNLVKIGKQNEIPLFAGGGVGKNGNLAANAAALIMLGASGVQVGKYIMQATAGCLGSEMDRCNICNIGLCPKGITSQDPRLYRRLDPEKVAERLVDVYLSFDAELKKIVAPLGRSTSLPIGMSDALGIADRAAAERLGILYAV